MFKKSFLLLLILWLSGVTWFASIIPDSKDIVPSARVTDSIVVLTGGSDRVAKGFELLLGGKAMSLFISGVGEGITLENLIAANGGSDAQKNKLKELHSVIILGRKAPDTYSNAQETQEWLQEQRFTSIRLVTANYHMPRAMLEFTKRMPEVDIIEEPVMPSDFKLHSWWKDGRSLRLVVSEYMKYIAVRIGR
jgi:uncharacterized SAM-binding protein YcdF (DUF218 family)